jgi:hypothetical protein
MADEPAMSDEDLARQLRMARAYHWRPDAVAPMLDAAADAIDRLRALLPDDSTPAEHPSRIRILVDTCGHKAGDEVEPITWNVNGSPWVSNRLVTNASVRLSAGQWAPAATPELQEPGCNAVEVGGLIWCPVHDQAIADCAAGLQEPAEPRCLIAEALSRAAEEPT